MSELLRFFKDMRDNGYGLAEIAAQLGTSAIAEPVAGFAAMYDPVNGAAAIREGMTYTPRTEAGQMYRQGAAKTLGAMAQPAMPVIDAWQRGVDVAGKYSPVAGAALQTVPTALGALMGYKPAMQTGRQVSNSLGAMQARMIANANAPSTFNGYRNQRGAINPVQTTPKRPLTEFEQAHLTAQRNAALPVNQGGLGLHPDNTAMDRARAMGFDVDNPVYHGTGADIEAFDPKLLKETSQYMKGVFTTDKPDIASNYGDTVYPLVQKQGYTLKDKRTDRASGKTPKEVDTIRDKDKNIIVTTKPENIRSRFAAFDPFNRDSSNLLATTAPLVPTTALGAYMYNEKRKKSQGKQ